MATTNQTLELERHLGTRTEFVVYIDQTYYQAQNPAIASVADAVKQFKVDLAAWLTAQNEWGNLHVVSELPYMACVLLSCDQPVAQKLSASLPGVTAVQEWIEK